MCLLRTQLLRDGARLTQAHAAVVDALGVPARVLPMSDEPVQTWVRHGGRTMPFQEYMIVEHAAAPVEGVELRGIEAARPSAEVLDARRQAELIVIGPSNPVISIGPILQLAGMREALDVGTRAGRGREPVRGRAFAQGPDRRNSAPGPGSSRTRRESPAPTRA